MTCYRCEKEITDRSDLVVANIKMTVKPFHEKCFKKHLEEKKERASMFFDAMPFNGRYANVMTAIFLLMIVFFLVFLEVPALAYILCLIYPFYRLMSWVKLERKLPKT